MDVQYPYADGLSRLQLLYRLPTPPAPRRLLVVCADHDGALIGGGWVGGSVTVVAVSALESVLDQGAQQFDAVALPAVLGRSLARPSVDHSASGDGKLLGLARELLVPGGIVVGHMAHACALRHLLRWSGLREFIGAMGRPQGIGCASHCLSRLRQAGLAEAECFFVQPSIDAPMGLIPSQGAASRANFLRAIRSAQGHYGRVGFRLRLMLAYAGLGGLLQSHLFFWARRPC